VNNESAVDEKKAGGGLVMDAERLEEMAHMIRGGI
jgi:hypothetical protein